MRSRGKVAGFESATSAVAELLLDWVFPPVCPGCEAYPARRFCRACMDRMPPPASPMCPRCGLPYASTAAGDHLCSACVLRPSAIEKIRACAIYDADRVEPGPLERALKRFKYGRDLSLSRALADLLAERCPTEVGARDLAVPVPLHVGRLRHRGFNQSQLLAGGPARRFGLRVDPLALERVRPTVPQVGMSAARRRRNVRGAFRADAARVGEKRILLVDDVCTSGATLEEGAAALLRAGAASVHAVVLARAIQP